MHTQENYDKAFFQVLAENDIGSVVALLKSGAKPIGKTPSDHTPIQVADHAKQWAMVKAFARHVRDDDDKAHFGAVLLDAAQANEIAGSVG